MRLANQKSAKTVHHAHLQSAAPAAAPWQPEQPHTIQLSREQFEEFEKGVFALDGLQELLSSAEGNQAEALLHLVNLIHDQLWSFYEELSSSFSVEAETAGQGQ